MTAWTHGYVADSPYTFAYQSALAPGLLALTCAMMGVAWTPRPRMAVADIGCGRGYTVNALAAANPEWTVLGLDYNPAHVAEAAALAEAAQLGNAVFVEADLASLTDAEIDELPEFDVVGLHGVWTWVDDSVRAGIVRLLARRLKPGGLCYIGYNAMPGFGADLALQRLFRHLAAQQHGASRLRVRASVDTVKALHATRPVHLASTPMLRRVTEDDTPIDPDYLAHEFLTAHWRPAFFEDLCADLAPAKLEHVGSIGLHENMPDLQFTPEQRAIHDAMPPGLPREFLKDLCTQRAFRRDVFVRGLRRVDPVAALDVVVLAACRLPGDEPPQLGVPVGVAELGRAVWGPIARALEEGPHSLGRLRRLSADAAPTAAELAAVLVGCGRAVPVLRESGPTPACQRFNRAVALNYAEEGRSGSQFAMASPVMAAALPCHWTELALAVQPEVGQAGAADAPMLARCLFPDIDGDALDSATQHMATMLAERVPVWRRLGII